MKVDLSSLLLEELIEYVKEIGLPQYRGEQIFRQLSRGNSIDEMTDLSKALRNSLSENCDCAMLFEEDKFIDKDGTVKYLFRLSDGNLIETVLMRYKHGNSVCISSQVGCKMGCKFCASTLNGKVRNLTAGEMLAQVAYVNKNDKVSHIVVMGVGEPLDNFKNLIIFIQNVNNPKGLNISQRNISISTCGLVDKIYELAEKKLQITLSVSLHAPDNQTRDKLMPINTRYNVEELIKACRDYIEITGRRISFEYTLIKGVNDSDFQAERLSEILKKMICHVNLIPVNFVIERGLYPSSNDRINKFKSILEKRGINVTVRRTLGGEINASCGQLRHKHIVKK